MLGKPIFVRLKQQDLSKDKAKTSLRVSRIWKSLTAAEKQSILHLAGVSSATVGRTRKDGKISIKTALAFAQTTGDDPYYLIGQSDDNNMRLDDNRDKQFLRDCGYGKLVDEYENGSNAPSPRATRKNKTAEAIPQAVEVEEEAPKAEIAAQETQPEPLPENEAPTWVEETVAAPQNIAVPQNVLTNEPSPAAPVSALKGVQEYADGIISNTPVDELSALDSIGLDEIMDMVKSLSIQAKHSKASSSLNRLVRMVLVR